MVQLNPFFATFFKRVSILFTALVCAVFFKKMRYIVGIDEVSRSNVLGPMVIALVGVPEDLYNSEWFNSLNIKDSKKMLLSTIKKVSNILSDKVYVDYAIVSAKEISESKNLNDLEATQIMLLINKFILKGLKYKTIYIDNPDQSAEKFVSRTGLSLPNVVIENRADENYKACSLASIFAKNKFEEEKLKLEQKYGDLGSFSPSDYRTLNFILNNIDSDIIRKNYITYKRLLNKKIFKELKDTLKTSHSPRAIANVYKKYSHQL